MNERRTRQVIYYFKPYNFKIWTDELFNHYLHIFVYFPFQDYPFKIHSLIGKRTLIVLLLLFLLKGQSLLWCNSEFSFFAPYSLLCQPQLNGLCIQEFHATFIPPLNNNKTTVNNVHCRWRSKLHVNLIWIWMTNNWMGIMASMFQIALKKVK